MVLLFRVVVTSCGSFWHGGGARGGLLLCWAVAWSRQHGQGIPHVHCHWFAGWLRLHFLHLSIFHPFVFWMVVLVTRSVWHLLQVTVVYGDMVVCLGGSLY